MKKFPQKVLDPKKDVLTRLKHLRALLGEERSGAPGSGAPARTWAGRGSGLGCGRYGGGVRWGWRETLLSRPSIVPRQRALWPWGSALSPRV